jgi:hypothetical protein
VSYLLPITDEIKLQCFNVVFAEMLGGEKPIEILNQYYGDGMTLDEIARIQGLKFPQQVARIINTSRVRLAKCGLWPKDWHKPPRQGRKAKAIVGD